MYFSVCFQNKEEAAAAEAEKKGRHGSRSSSKSRASRDHDRPESASQQIDIPAEPEEHWPVSRGIRSYSCKSWESLQ